MISFIYSGFCINIESRCNILLIVLSSVIMTWPLRVDLCYSQELNGFLCFSGSHTNFSRISNYIFVEKMVSVQGFHFCRYASDPKFLLEHKFNDH